MSKIEETDNSKELISKFKRLNEASIRWGARGKTQTNKLVWNEFGAGKIPERPVTRITFGSSKTHTQINKAAKIAINQVIEEDRKVEDALKIIGEIGLSEYRKTFRSNIPPPNAESTIKRKGEGKNTLYDKGDLFNSLGFDVIL